MLWFFSSSERCNVIQHFGLFANNMFVDVLLIHYLLFTVRYISPKTAMFKSKWKDKHRAAKLNSKLESPQKAAVRTSGVLSKGSFARF